jgi:hypothetical protein
MGEKGGGGDKGIKWEKDNEKRQEVDNDCYLANHFGVFFIICYYLEFIL